MLPTGELELLVYQDEGNLCDVKSVGAGVLERRINWGPGYRVYFGRDGVHLVILLGGGTKQRQDRDIEEARRRWADYKCRRQLLQGGET